MFLVVVIVILCVLYALWRPLKHRHGSPPVYPGALPFIGHTHQLLGDPEQLWQTEKKLYQFCLDNGGVIEIRFGPRPVYVIADIEDCLTVANTCFEKPYLYKFGKELYDWGLITADATIWKQHRKLLNPAFNQQILNTFVQEHSAQAKRLVSELASEVDKGPFDVIPYLLNNVLRGVYKTTIGSKTNDYEQEVTLKNYVNATDLFCNSVGTRTRNILLHISFIFNMSSLKRQQDVHIRNIKNITETIIKKRKSELKEKIETDTIKESASGYKSLLDQLLEATEQKTFTDEEIREHLDTIIGAAHDSSTMAMTFCLLLVGSHPDVQARIYKELQEVLDDPERDLIKYDLPKLVYLEAVLKETLRLYTIVPRIGRCSDSAVKLKHYTLPAGSYILISLYGMNRHPIWGADVNEFKPERWLDPATLPGHPNTFATFSIGKRNCIETSLGLNTPDQTMIDTDYAETIDELFALYCDRFQKVWLHLPFIFNWSAMKRKETVLLTKLKNIIDPIIFKRKAELKANNDDNVYDHSTPGKFKPVLYQMLKLTEDQDVFTDSDIREHLDTFVAAAYDTTSSTLTLILLVIGSDQNMQERIFNELKEVLKHEDDDLTKQDLSKLIYLEAVIKESIRMYPPVPIIGRKVDKEINLRNCTLRAGNTCIIGVYGLLRHPMWGPDADQFRPERWLNSATLPDHPSLNAGFGIGKRNCIGKLYSTMFMKIALAHILRRFQVTGDINRVVCEFDVVLKPVEENLITLTHRS